MQKKKPQKNTRNIWSTDVMVYASLDKKKMTLIITDKKDGRH